MAAHVAVMGAGSWGTAFASLCADAGSDVVLWARRGAVADAITADHRNPDYLADIDLNPALRRLVVEGKDGVRRSLKAQAADA